MEQEFTQPCFVAPFACVIAVFLMVASFPAAVCTGKIAAAAWKVKLLVTVM